MKTLIKFFNLCLLLTAGFSISSQAAQAGMSSGTFGHILTVVCNTPADMPTGDTAKFPAVASIEPASAYYGLPWSSFAIPDSQFQKVLITLDRAIEDMLYLGIVAKECSTGIILEQIIHESPAHKAALKQGSLVISVNGSEISTLEALKDALADARELIQINWQHPVQSLDRAQVSGQQLTGRHRLPYEAVADSEQDLWYEAMNSETTLLESGIDAVSGYFNLKAELTDISGGTIRLVNEAGETAWSGIIPAGEPVYQNRIDLQLLPRGIYTVIIEQPGGVSSHKVLIH